MTTTITILIADDHPLFRRGLKQVIDAHPEFSVVAEADNGITALEMMQHLQPTVAVLDLDMPGLDGFSVAEQAAALGVTSRIVILTMHRDEMHLERAIELGIPGYVIKDGAGAEVVLCVTAVAKGGQYVTPSLSTYLMSRGRRSTASPAVGSFESLTPAERRVLALLADLRTTREIAATLGISPRTVDNHRAHICTKLDLQGPHALARFAVRHKTALTDHE